MSVKDVKHSSLYSVLLLVSRFQSFFAVAGPQACNQLSTSIRQMDSNAAFRRHLKAIVSLWKRTVHLIK